jgi:pectate lyase
MVEGTISNGTAGGQIRIKANKSIIGVGSTALLSGVGLDMTSQNNIIVQNLKITLVGTSSPKDINGGDCISISGTSKNIWIDHCELYSENPDVQTDIDKYDGLLDIKQQTGFITISWCYLHDHHKGGLVGAADDDLYADRLVTIHHNYYNKVKLRVPMYRGATGHFFNNYVKDADKASEIRAGTCVRVEKNYYENYEQFAIYTTADAPGQTERIDNYLNKTQSRAYPGNCTANIPYSYSAVLTNTTADVKTIVPQYAGVGKLGTCTTKTWYGDADGDGFGDPAVTQSSCIQPTGYVEDKTDLCPSDANKARPGQCGCGVLESVCVDCDGVKNGSATLDNCSRCIGGSTGKTACTSVGEAETDACAFDGITETKNTDYKGTSYLNVDNAVGTAITFNVSATNAGTATLSFRYANGGTVDRPAQISLNGAVLSNNLSFPVTGSFTDWKAVDLSLMLVKGINVLKLISTTAEGLPNIDQIGYVSTGTSAGSCVITSIDVSGASQQVSIYPNPSHGSFQANLSTAANIHIFDMEGRLLEAYKNISKVEFGENLKPGIYFLKIDSKVYKLIKE